MCLGSGSALMYTLNRKSTINFKGNKARLELVKKYLKAVANHSNISGTNLFKFSFDICVKIFQDVTKIFLARIFPYSVQMWKNTDQKKLRI